MADIFEDDFGDFSRSIYKDFSITDITPYKATVITNTASDGAVENYNYSFNQAYVFNNSVSGSNSRLSGHISGMNKEFIIPVNEDIEFQTKITLDKQNLRIVATEFFTGEPSPEGQNTGNYSYPVFEYKTEDNVGNFDLIFPVCSVRNEHVINYTLRDNIFLDKPQLKQMGETGSSTAGQGGQAHLIVESGRSNDELPIRFRGISGGSGIQVRYDSENASGGSYIIIDQSSGAASADGSGAWTGLNVPQTAGSSPEYIYVDDTGPNADPVSKAQFRGIRGTAVTDATVSADSPTATVNVAEEDDVVEISVDLSNVVGMGCQSDFYNATTSIPTGSIVLGGRFNKISGYYNVISAGAENKISGGQLNFIGGGSGNDVNWSRFSSSLGGKNNDISGSNYSVLLGGDNNLIVTGHAHFIGGGVQNRISGSSSTISNAIGGGTENKILGATYSFIGAGGTNTVYANNSVIGGGTSNIASGDSSVVFGGSDNKVLADYGVAAGRYSTVQASHNGAFVLSDSNTSETLSSGANTLTLNFKSGVYVDSDSGIYINGNPVMTGSSPEDVDTLQTVTDRGNTTTNSIIVDEKISGVSGLFSSAVGIGTVAANVNATLTVEGDGGTSAEFRGGALKVRYLGTEGQIQIAHVGAEGRIVASKPNWGQAYPLKVAGDYVRICTSGAAANTEVIRFTTGGYVGIGTSEPSEKLDVNGSIMLRGSTNHRYKVANDSNNNWAEIGNDGASSQNTLEFFTKSSSVPAMSITNDDRVGIGTISPNKQVEIRATEPYLRLEEGDSGGNKRLDLWVSNSTGVIGANQSAQTMMFQTVGDTRMTITSAGAVGIGTTSPAGGYLLNVTGDIFLGDNSPSTAGRSFVAYTASLGVGKNSIATIIGRSVKVSPTTNNSLVTLPYSTDGTLWYSQGYLKGHTWHRTAGIANGVTISESTGELMRLTTGGYVGIGTDDPAYPLDVLGKAAIGSDGTFYWGNTHDYGKLTWDGTRAIVRGRAGKALSLGANGTQDYVYIATDGNVGISNTNPQYELHVSGDVAGTGIGDRITLNGTGYLLSGDAEANVNLQEATDNGNTTTNSIISTGPYISGVTGLFSHVDITGASTLTVSGKAGIGTASPSTQLDVAGTGAFRRINIYDTTYNANPRLCVGRWEEEDLKFYVDDMDIKITAVQDTDGDGDHRFILDREFAGTGASSFHIAHSGGYELTIDKNHKVGMGVNNPSDFDGGGNRLVIGDGAGSEGMTIYTDTSSAGAIHFADGTAGSETYRGIVQYRHSNDRMDFWAGAGRRMVIDGNGVGIGTYTVTSKLEVSGAYSDSLAKFRDGPDGVEIATRGTSRQQIDFLGTNTSSINAKGSLFINYDTNNDGSNDGISFTRNGIDEAGTADMVITEGKVGIGTTDPSSKLHVNAGSLEITSGSHVMTNNYSITWGTGQASKIYAGDGVHDMAFTAGSSLAMIINGSSQNVGIGTNAPAYKLDIQAAAAEIAQIKRTNGGNCEFLINPVGGDAKVVFQNSGTDIWAIGKDNSDSSFRISEGGALETNPRFTVDNGGNVGIGTTNPAKKLTVYHAGNAQASITGTNVAILTISDPNSHGQLNTYNDGTFRINSQADAGGTQLVLSGSNVGVGTAFPSYKLDVNGTIHGTSGNFEDGITVNGNPVLTGTSAHETDTLQTVTDDGNTTTNSIYINGSGDDVNYAPLNVSGANTLALLRGTSTYAYLQFQNSTTSYGSVSNNGLTVGNNGNDAYVFQREAAPLYLGTSGEARMTIAADGRVGIGILSPDNPLEVLGADNGIKISSAVTDRPRLTFDCGGAEKLLLSSNSTYGAIGDSSDINRYMVFKDGDVGIGTNAPSATLDVDGGIKLLDNNYLTWRGSNTRINANSDYLQFQVAASDTMRLTSSGNVGIGTITPYAYETTATRLHVKNAGSAGSVSELARFEGASDADGAGAIVRIGTSNDRGVYLEGGRVGSVPYASIGTTEYDGAKTEGIRIDSAGKVGIGLTNPSYALEVTGAGSVFAARFDKAITDNSADGYAHSFGVGSAHILGKTVILEGTLDFSPSSPDATSSMYRWQNSSNELVLSRVVGGSTIDNNIIQVSGNSVGIGTPNPRAKLHVEGSRAYSLGYLDYTSDLHIGNDTMSSAVGAYAGSLTFGSINESNLQAASIVAIQTDTDPNEIGLAFFTQHSSAGSTDLAESMRISNDGKVGIGTTTPTHQLHLNKENAISEMQISRGGSDPSTNTDIGGIQFKTDYSATAQDVGRILVKTNNSAYRTDMKFSARSNGGTEMIGMTLHGTPDEGPRLGVSTQTPQAELEVAGSIFITGTGSSSKSSDLYVYGSGNNYGLLVERDRNDAMIVVKTPDAGAYFMTDSATSSFQGYKIGSNWFMGQYGHNDFRIVDGTQSAGDAAAALTVQNTTKYVGIGTTAPACNLQVDNYTGAAGHAAQGVYGDVSFFSDDGDDALFLGLKDAAYQDRGWAFQVHANGVNSDLAIKEHGSSAERVRITTAGNVGIGTNAPLALLDVAGNHAEGTAEWQDLAVGSAAAGWIDTDDGIGRIDFYGRSVGGLKVGASIAALADANWNGSVPHGRLEFKTAAGATAETRMTIDSNGYVGIGTNAPSYNLDVVGTTRSTYYVGGAYLEENASSSKLKFYTNGSVLVMDEDGSLKPCEKENDTLVFGVSKKDFDQPIVLGAEPVLITGPIKVGDYIVTSNKQGHGQAMKEEKLGTIIAQAMENGDGESYNIKAMIRKI